MHVHPIPPLQSDLSEMVASALAHCLILVLCRFVGQWCWAAASASIIIAQGAYCIGLL